MRTRPRIALAFEALARARAELSPSRAGLLSDRVQRAEIDIAEAQGQLELLVRETAEILGRRSALAVELRPPRDLPVPRCFCGHTYAQHEPAHAWPPTTAACCAEGCDCATWREAR